MFPSPIQAAVYVFVAAGNMPGRNLKGVEPCGVEVQHGLGLGPIDFRIKPNLQWSDPAGIDFISPLFQPAAKFASHWWSRIGGGEKRVP